MPYILILVPVLCMVTFCFKIARDWDHDDCNPAMYPLPPPEAQRFWPGRKAGKDWYTDAMELAMRQSLVDAHQVGHVPLTEKQFWEMQHPRYLERVTFFRTFESDIVDEEAIPV